MAHYHKYFVGDNIEGGLRRKLGWKLLMRRWRSLRVGVCPTTTRGREPHASFSIRRFHSLMDSHSLLVDVCAFARAIAVNTGKHLPLDWGRSELAISLSPHCQHRLFRSSFSFSPPWSPPTKRLCEPHSSCSRRHPGPPMQITRS
jgi:hypothetical protein